MKLLTSEKFKLPKIFFISDREEIKELPIGIPFIYANSDIESYIVRLLEYEILYERAVKSGFPFNFKRILEDNGYSDLKHFSFGSSVYSEHTTSGNIKEEKLKIFEPSENPEKMFESFIKDSAAYVNIEVLKNLNVFPVWLSEIEEAITTNIQNYAIFNPNMYNKKLDGMYGGIELTSPKKNLIIIDISGSIPRAVSSTCLVLAKNLTESFYADLIITGSVSTFYLYEEVYKLDVKKVYENGMNNDQAYFKKIISSSERNYGTAIVFGDNDYPGNRWAKGDIDISDEDGKKLCKWNIDKLISLHTLGTKNLAAYGRWFTPKEEKRIENWVTYLDNNY